MDKKMKHTPGPWVVLLTKLQSGLRIRHIKTEREPRIIIAYVEPNPAREDADARLIATSPELLEALINLEMNARNAAVFVPHTLLIKAVEQAQRVIAKATGQKAKDP